jgi:hypothetical protein
LTYITKFVRYDSPRLCTSSSTLIGTDTIFEMIVGICSRTNFRAILDDEHERVREEESLALYFINIRLEQGSQPPNVKNLCTFDLPWSQLSCLAE